MNRNLTNELQPRNSNSRLVPINVLVGIFLFSILNSALPAADRGSMESSSDLLDLTRLSIEELGNIRVTSVSRKSEKLSAAPAAIHVITQEDIRRSGVTSLAEALRMAPGLTVARSNTRQWGISARGFNDIFANKLLVLIDGRTIYTPLFSGVFWEETDTVLEDVDRIEVIRGPGATLWGANAVNGVINIITKNARDTQGFLISAGGGIEERGFGTVRYGGKISDSAFFRVYAKYTNRDDSTLFDGSDGGDWTWMSQSGFRLDWQPSEIDTVTFQGDYYFGELGGKVFRHVFTPPDLIRSPFRSNSEGGDLLGRWTHSFSEESEVSLQTSLDRTDHGFGIGSEIRNTIDVDVQHRFPLGDRNEIVWGGGYRYSKDEVRPTSDFALSDPSQGIQLASLFVQDEISVVPDRLHLTLGTKLEHNDFTGFEFQPSARVSWTPNTQQTLWAAISRAVRTPSRVERQLSSYAEPWPLIPEGILTPVVGNPDFGSEDLLAYEIGYRATLHPRVTMDLAAFYNVYDHLRSFGTLPLELRESPIPHLITTTTLANDLFGETFGAEVLATWRPADFWRIRTAYSLLEMQLHTALPERSPAEDFEEGSSPNHQLTLWSEVDIGRHVEWGIGVRYIDRLSFWEISDYTELESRLAWKPTPNCELAIVGRNLLHDHRREHAPLLIAVRNAQIDRSIYGKITWRF